jgi:hypothetical protein
MKILIAYDGSEFADTAIDGLQRASRREMSYSTIRFHCKFRVV